MTHTVPKDMAEAKALLHAGRLEMKRPTSRAALQPSSA